MPFSLLLLHYCNDELRIWLFLMMFFNLPKKVVINLYTSEGILIKIHEPFVYVFATINVVLLSMLVIFSKIKDYFPPKNQRKMKIAIFFICVASISENISGTIYNVLKFNRILNYACLNFCALNYEQFLDTVYFFIV